MLHNFAYMIHRGEIVRKEIDKSGYNKSLLAERLGISRGTLYNKLEETNLNWEFIFQLGKIINHDFSIDFPELRKKTYIMCVYSIKQLMLFIRILD